jgi:hypothetical protein
VSQERTRFPIQPKDVRRSARSNKDVALDGRGGQGRAKGSSDKPTAPPHKRHEAEAEAEVESEGAAESED